MKTTIRLEDDVAAAVDRLRREEGLGLSEAVNALIRRALATNGQRKRFVQKTHNVGVKIDISDNSAVLDYLDRLDE